MSATRTGKTGGAPPHPLMAYQGVAHFEFFQLDMSCGFPTLL